MSKFGNFFKGIGDHLSKVVSGLSEEAQKAGKDFKGPDFERIGSEIKEKALNLHYDTQARLKVKVAQGAMAENKARKTEFMNRVMSKANLEISPLTQSALFKESRAYRTKMEEIFVNNPNLLTEHYYIGAKLGKPQTEIDKFLQKHIIFQYETRSEKGIVDMNKINIDEITPVIQLLFGNDRISTQSSQTNNKNTTTQADPNTKSLGSGPDILDLKPLK